MMLNADQIIEKKLLKLEHSKGKAAQIGYDLSLREVNQIGNQRDLKGYKIGKVLKDKTNLTNYTPIDVINLDETTGWLLHEGTYDITFNEGCNIPANYVGLIRQRSSLLRNGTVLHSSVFDPGFETEFMGTLLYVHEPLFIEKDARVAQIYFHECEAADKYDGQWQNDKQRNSL